LPNVVENPVRVVFTAMVLLEAVAWTAFVIAGSSRTT
jgi:hypothetical protein